MIHPKAALLLTFGSLVLPPSGSYAVQQIATSCSAVFHAPTIKILVDETSMT